MLTCGDSFCPESTGVIIVSYFIDIDADYSLPFFGFCCFGGDGELSSCMVGDAASPVNSGTS